MSVKIASTYKILMTLLTTLAALDVISLFLFSNIDGLVNGDLYRYNLQFSYDWASRYWTYSLQLNAFIIAAIISVVATLASTLFYTRTREKSLRYACYLLLAFAAVLQVFSVFSFSRIDHLVNSDLYNYGLQFSTEWATPYWISAYEFLGLMWAVVIVTFASAILVYHGPQETIKIDQTKLISAILGITAIVALAISVTYTSSVLAFIGLGLLFWGIILIYIRTDRYAKRTLLEAAAVSSLATLEKLVRELDYEGNPIYLPPKYLKDTRSCKAFIPKQKEEKLPNLEQLQEREEDKLIQDSPEGILITPPGAELTRLFEKTLQTDFTRVDLQWLQQNMPKLFIESMEIADEFELEVTGPRIRAKMENPAFDRPLASAVACCLAKATGRPIIIEDQRKSEDSRLLIIEYRVMEEEKTYK
jgi:hypothetical protein